MNSLYPLVQALADCLDEKFGYEIYTDENKQDFSEPCFFIELVNSRMERINKNRFKVNALFCIHYFPEEKEREPEDISQTEELINMADDLYSLLEVFQGEGRAYRSHGMSHNEGAGILHFTFTVTYHLYEQEEHSFMEKLIHKEALKDWKISKKKQKNK